MGDQPDRPENGGSATGESSASEPELLKADDIVLPDPDVSADAVEPVLDTSADEVTLSEPSLGAAEITPDSAVAASLDAAAAEAESVAQEAENVGTLVGGPRPPEDRTEAAEPAGTAPAGGKAGDATADETQSAELASFAASGGEPSWTGPAQEQSRWDELFEAGQANASPSPGDKESADAAPADAHPHADEPGESAALPAGMPDQPSTSPDEAPQPAAPPRESPSAAAETATVAETSSTPEAARAHHPFTGPHPQAPGSPVPPVSPGAPVGGPYGLPPAGSAEAPPTRIRARAVGRSSRGSDRNRRIVLGAVGLIVLALLIFAITSIVGALRADDAGPGPSTNTTPGADGIIAESISPLDLAAGTCILGFDSADVSADVTTVTCATPHNAQLLATISLPDDSEFPGEGTLNASGNELCNSVPIDESAASEYADLTLTQVTPTSGTWAQGDRRIDCFVVSEEGNVLTDDLLAE